MKRIAALFQPPWLFLFASLAAFFPFLFLGQTYFDDDLLNVHSVFIAYLKIHLQAGHLPFWNPFIFAGQPFMADPLTLSFYPLLYPILLLSVPLGLSVLMAAHAVLAASGMYFWLGQLGLSKNAKVWGALTFAFSGFFWCEVIHPNVLANFAWLPWVLGSLEKTVRTPKPWNAFILGLTGAVLCSTLYPQIHLGTAYFCLIYFVFSVINTGDWKNKLGGFLRCSPFLALGFFPVSVGVMPFLEFMRFSDRLRGLGYETFNAGLSLLPQSLPQFLFPIPAGHPGPANSGIPPLYWGDEGFLGLWALFFFALSFSKIQKWLKIGLAFSAGLFLLLALGKYFPLHRWACQWIFGLDLLRGPFRFLFIYVAAMTVLASWGYEKIWENQGVRKPVLVGGGLFIVLIIFLNFASGDWNQERQAWLFLAGALSLLLGLNQRNKNWAQPLFLLTVFSSLLLNGWSHASSRFGPASDLDLDKEKPLLEEVETQTGRGRVFLGDNIPFPAEAYGKTLRLELPPNTSSLFNLWGVGGNDSMSLSQRGDLYTLSFKTFSKLMAIQGFATGNEKGKVPGFTRMEWGPVKFYKATEQKPWVYAPAKVSVVPDAQKRLETMRDPAFDPYQEAVLSYAPAEVDLGTKGPRAVLRYDWKEDGINRQVFTLSLDHPNWVVFSEPNYPGWKAWVDQVPTEIVTSNHLYRGLFVPGGEHEVLFSYQPTWFRLGAFGLLVWLVFSMAFWPNYFRQKSL